MADLCNLNVSERSVCTYSGILIGHTLYIWDIRRVLWLLAATLESVFSDTKFHGRAGFSLPSGVPYLDQHPATPALAQSAERDG